MKILFVLSVAVCFVSCLHTRSVHSPTAFTAPLFSDSCRLELSGFFVLPSATTIHSSNKDSVGFAYGVQASAAYRPFKNTYVFSNFYTGSETDYFASGDPSSFYSVSKTLYRRNLMELGFGYGPQLFKASESEVKLFLHVNSSFTLGKLDWKEDLTNFNVLFQREWHSSLKQWNIQSMLRARYDQFDLGIGYRIARTFYSNTSSSYLLNEKQELQLQNLNNRTYIETLGMLGYTFKKLPIHLQSQLIIAADEFNSTRVGTLTFGIAYLFKRPH